MSRDGISWVRSGAAVAGVRGEGAAHDVGTALGPNGDWWAFDTCHVSPGDVQVCGLWGAGCGVCVGVGCVRLRASLRDNLTGIQVARKASRLGHRHLRLGLRQCMRNNHVPESGYVVTLSALPRGRAACAC